MRLLLAHLLLASCAGSDSGKHPSETADADGDGWADAEDCAPEDAAVNPSVEEVCNNGVDDDCDGGADACRLQGHVPVDALAAVDLEAGEELWDYTLASIGDVDGDGRRDILVGAPQHADGAGRLYVLASSEPLPATVSGGWASIEGTLDATDGLGGAVAGVGDLDGDGTDDLVARALPAEYSDEGNYYFVLGFSAPEGGALNADSAVVRWESDTGHLGHVVSGGGDVTADGLPDTALSFHGYRTAEGPTPLLVVFGPPTEAESVPAAALYEDESTSLHHTVISTLARSDLDGDGVDDLVAGAPRDGYGAEGSYDQGVVILFSGPLLEQILVEEADRTTETGAPDESSTPLVFEAGDIDADGIDDLIVGDPVAAGGGAAYVLTSDWPSAIADSSATIVASTYSRYLGRCAAGPGDVDGDGAADLLVTDNSYDSDGVGLEGAAYLFYGPVVGSQTIDASGFSTTGVNTGEELGATCAALGDWNGDTRPDVGITSDPQYPYPETSSLFLVFGGGI